MPFANEHSGRFQDPKKFDPLSFRRNDSDVFGKKLPPGVMAIWAKIKGKAQKDDPVIPQAIRFPKDKYTVAQAKKWLADNKFKVILFEPAKKETKESKFETNINEQSDAVLKESLKAVKSWYLELKNEDESECSEEEIIDISKMLLCEMIQRDTQRFHPENWKAEAIELYTKTFNEIMLEGIEIPENIREFLSLQEEDLEEGIRPAFGSPGGKRSLAKTIVSYMPEHKTYVESFAGGAAVFFAKKPSDKEILNDKNSEIAFAYKFMKEGDIKATAKMNWVIKEDYFNKLKNSNPKTDVDRFHKFVYLRLCSYGCDEAGTVDKGNIGKKKMIAERLPQIKERLLKVKIYNQDYNKLFGQFDSKDSFFYLDPPYTGDKTDKFKNSNMNWDTLNSQLKKLKGKFILSCHTAVRNSFKGFNIKEVKVVRTMDIQNSGRTNDKELLISNFPLKSSSKWLAEGEPVPSPEPVVLPLPKFILRNKRNSDSDRGNHEILISYPDKYSLNRFMISGDLFEQEESKVDINIMNIPTPNGEEYRCWLDWEGSIPAGESKLIEVTVEKEEDNNKYIVNEKGKAGSSIETRESLAKFKNGQTAWMDQWKNLYTGNRGGVAFGNPNQKEPTYIDIQDRGEVEVLESSDHFASFKFGGEKINGFWTLRKENPGSDVWILSKGQDVEEAIKESHRIPDSTNITELHNNPGECSITINDEHLPIKIVSDGSTYVLSKTKNKKLILQK